MHSCPTTIRKYLAIPENEIPESRAISRERQHQLAVQQKQREVDEARNLAKAGYPIERIATILHHTRKTIQNYLNPGYSVTDGHYNGRIPGKLAPYEKEVIELRSQGLGLHIPKFINPLWKRIYWECRFPSDVHVKRESTDAGTGRTK